MPIDYFIFNVDLLKVKHKKEEEIKDKAEEQEQTEKSHQWKKTTKHKQRYFYRDAEDVIQEGKPVSSIHTQQRY